MSSARFQPTDPRLIAGHAAEQAEASLPFSCIRCRGGRTRHRPQPPRQWGWDGHRAFQEDDRAETSSPGQLLEFTLRTYLRAPMTTLSVTEEKGWL